MLIGSLLLLR